MTTNSEWTPPHTHDPNPVPPSADPSFVLITAGGATQITLDYLSTLPQQSVDDCYIISTEHGPSGPFSFGGVPLLDLIERHAAGPWATATVMSADGFGARVSADELHRETARPALLALSVDGRPLSRTEGLVRLVVPGETNDALRQVKWVGEIRLR
jgi:DMSO/TMAO reductase YedYZ molybdopterin-dependent catalytic subunit